MRIEQVSIYTEVPDDVELKEKGLIGPMRFEVRVAEGWQGMRLHPLATPLGTFTLEPMPGCCGVVVSTSSYLEPQARGLHSVGKDFHALKAQVAAHFGYRVMLMTTQLTNLPEVIGASKAKWKFFHTFRNKRTDNDIGIAYKAIW